MHQFRKIAVQVCQNRCPYINKMDYSVETRKEFSLLKAGQREGPQSLELKISWEGGFSRTTTLTNKKKKACLRDAQEGGGQARPAEEVILDHGHAAGVRAEGEVPHLRTPWIEFELILFRF